METFNQKNKKTKQEMHVEKKIKRRNFISFATFFVAGGAAFEGWKWLYHSPSEIPGIQPMNINH